MPTLLETSSQRLIVAAELGGAVLGWDWRSAAGAWLPLFRPSAEAERDPYALACFPLLPWANRVSQGGFALDGRHLDLALNRQGEPFPIHGDAWLQPWSVRSQDPDTLTLALDSSRPAASPYHFEATQQFRLHPDGLDIVLQARALDAFALPYGIGLHSCFADAAGASLQASSSGVWMPGGADPGERRLEPVPAQWACSSPRPVSDLVVDHCFDGWDGQAQIDWPQRGLRLRLRTTPAERQFQLCRRAGQDSIWFEPVSHPVDAFHLPGMPGLRMLAAGETITLTLEMRVMAA